MTYVNPFAEIAELLGVDEVKVSHHLVESIVSVRIGDTWLSSTIDFRTLADSKSMKGEIADNLRQLAETLRKSVNVADAKGEDLDRLASIMGITRVRRPANRFEAVVEELEDGS